MNNLREKLGLPKEIQKIHCIGVGGSGMFPIIQILKSCGYDISGSDNNESDIVATERKMGINVIMGQSADNIKDADMVMYTAAILDTNEELVAAKNSGVYLYERAEILGAISKAFDKAIGVTGTHGKTTVTSMLTQIYFGANLDPSAVIGGKLKAIDGYGRAGESDIFLYEACEFKDHFLQTYPDISVILNIDNDHMEYFGTIENAIKSYVTFANKSKRVFYNISDKNTTIAIDSVNENVEKISFGWDNNADFYPENIVITDGFTRSFDLMRKGECLGNIAISVPGKHNILNAVCACAVAYSDDIPFEKIKAEIVKFTGAGRRFELVGRYKGATIVDDYAHHPAEIAATLNAAKELNFKRIWAVFQPFTFSRTQILLNEFAKALSIADKVVLSPIMGSREINTCGIKSEDLCEKTKNCIALPSFEKMAEYIRDNAEEGDIILTLGCGDIYKCARMICK